MSLGLLYCGVTVTQAIAFTRTLLDESRYEYYGTSSDLTTVFREALLQASIQKAREFWQRGEKEALRPLWMEQTVAGNPATLSFTPLYIESVRLQNHASDSFKNSAVYVPIEQWATGTFPNVSLGATTAGRYEFTHYDDKIHHNGDPTAGVRISYVKMPEVSVTLSDPMPMAEYTHAMICDRAARILYDKESPADERPMVGSLLDIQSMLEELAQNQQ